MENKSKFGLTAGLMGALVYLIGGQNSIALVVLFIAIALWEENEFVKVCVKRVAVLFLAYEILTSIISGISSIIGLFKYLAIFGKINTVISVAYTVILIVLALKSLINPTVSESILDTKAVDTVANVVSNVAAKVPSKPATKTCDKCGKTVDANATFCVYCGNKFEKAE